MPGLRAGCSSSGLHGEDKHSLLTPPELGQGQAFAELGQARRGSPQSGCLLPAPHTLCPTGTGPFSPNTWLDLSLSRWLTIGIKGGPCSEPLAAPGHRDPFAEHNELQQNPGSRPACSSARGPRHSLGCGASVGRGKMLLAPDQRRRGRHSLAPPSQLERPAAGEARPAGLSSPQSGCSLLLQYAYPLGSGKDAWAHRQVSTISIWKQERRQAWGSSRGSG